MQQESLYVPLGEHQLHLRHIWQSDNGVPVFMLHGAIENGKIFYTKSGKGLGSYLAKQGFNVYVADLRGRGESRPLINATSDFGQFEAITEDIPAFIDFIWQRHYQPMHAVCHSWGGVLLASYLARFPENLSKVRSKICFGTKRSVSVHSVEKLVKVDLIWKRLALVMARRKGFFDAKKYRIGSDNETARSLAESVAWVKQGPWHDPQDGFGYEQAAKAIHWPPSWHLTGIKDKVLGHPRDVQRFITESDNKQAIFSILSKANGNKLDYDHINILTAAEAEQDHFPELVSWLRQF